MSDVEVVKNNNYLVEDEFFSNLASACNEEHLSYCNCKLPAIQTRVAELIRDDMKEMISKGIEGNAQVLEERAKQCKRQAIKEVANECVNKGITCEIEKKLISQQLGYFKDRYNLKDPRVFVVLESLFRQMLSASRMQLHSNQKGILTTWYDKNGNKRLSLNPVEEIKLKYDEARINAIETLNKMMEGEKTTNININTKPISIEEIFKEIN